MHSVTNDTSTADSEKPALLLAESASNSKKFDTLQDQLPEYPHSNGNDTSSPSTDIEDPIHDKWNDSEFGRNLKKSLQSKKEYDIYGTLFRGQENNEIHVVVTKEDKYVLRPGMDLSWFDAHSDWPRSLYRILENGGPLQEHSLFPLGWLCVIPKAYTSDEDNERDERMPRLRDMRFIVAVDVTDTVISLWLIYD